MIAYDMDMFTVNQNQMNLYELIHMVHQKSYKIPLQPVTINKSKITGKTFFFKNPSTFQQKLQRDFEAMEVKFEKNDLYLRNLIGRLKTLEQSVDDMVSKK